MNTYYAYIRVSTIKQGEQGVSLNEQRDCITRFAERNNLRVVEWFEERETAAKGGRPVFLRLIRLLRQRKVAGLIVHKIDRSARNLKDWNEITSLAEEGIEIRFAGDESLDVTSRGGRLLADIQAVIASDYIRNLRDEVKKGFYGRIKQGFLPLPAPIGYLDQGRAKVKVLDPERAPLVKLAFELYGSGRQTLRGLVDELHRLGLRNRRGGRITLTGVASFLHNPFYIGLIRIKTTGELFPGIHKPLIPKSLFDRVQARFNGRVWSTGYINQFLFRQLLHCGTCGSILTGERQKGHVYYRCHGKHDTPTCIREEEVDQHVRRRLLPLQFNEQEKKYLSTRVEELRADWGKEQQDLVRTLKLRLDEVRNRLTRLSDAYIFELAIDKDLFEERKNALLMQRTGLEEQLTQAESGLASTADRLADFFELAGTAYLGYEMGNAEEKRELLKTVTSNRTGTGKELALELSFPFSELATRASDLHCAPYRDTVRTLDELLARLVQYFKTNMEKPSPPGALSPRPSQ